MVGRTLLFGAMISMNEKLIQRVDTTQKQVIFVSMFSIPMMISIRFRQWQRGALMWFRHQSKRVPAKFNQHTQNNALSTVDSGVMDCLESFGYTRCRVL